MTDESARCEVHQKTEKLKAFTFHLKFFAASLVPPLIVVNMTDAVRTSPDASDYNWLHGPKSANSDEKKLTQKTNFSLPSQHNQESPITGSDLIILTFLGVLFISNQIRRLD